MISTEVKYDRITKDFACYVDGRCVGYRATYSQGDTLIEQVKRDLIADRMAYTAAELDGAQADDQESSPGPDNGDDINAPIDRPRCSTCGDDGDCPDCDLVLA